VASCGAVCGAGIYQLGRAFITSRPSLRADLGVLYAPPARARPGDAGLGGLAGENQDRRALIGRWLTDAALWAGLQQALLGEELALAERPVEAHTTVRLLAALTGGGLGLGAWLLAMLAWPLTVLLAIGAVVFGGLAALMIVDRRVHRLAAVRRADARLAVAAYIDLVRILLLGGLPLHAALRAAADQGQGGRSASFVARWPGQRIARTT